MTRHLTPLLLVPLLLLSYGCCVAGAEGAVGAGEVDAGGAADAEGGAAAAAVAEGDWEGQLNAAATLDKAQDEIDQLKSIPDRIQAQVDVIMQPITDAEEVVNTISTLPSRLGISASELGGMAKASLDSGSVNITASVTGTARAEVEALLNKIKGIGVGLKETPQRVKVATKNIVELGAQAAGLATKIQASAKVAFGKKGEKKKADAAAAGQIVGQIKATVQSAKSKVMSLPAQASTVLAKLAASFAM